MKEKSPSGDANLVSQSEDEAVDAAKAEETTAPPDSPSNPRPSRSVLDFDSRRALREALENCSRRGSLCTLWDDESDDDYDDDGAEGTAPPSEGDWVTKQLDPLVSLPQTIDSEMDRLLVLRSYLLLDSDPEPSFERITSLATRFFNAPIALVSLVDLGRQWFMSNRGLPADVRETPRSMAFCAHAVQSVSGLLIVPDAPADPRFTSNPLVTGAPHIRFYAGAPLISPEGHRLGTLCIIDTKARPEGMSLSQKQTLKELAAMAVESMVRRRDDRLRLTDEASRAVACAAHDVLAPLEGARHALGRYLERAAAKEERKGDDNDMLRGDEEEDDGLDLIRTAETCLGAMDRICSETVKSFESHIQEAERRTKPADHGKDGKDGTKADGEDSAKDASGHGPSSKGAEDDGGVVVVADLVQRLLDVAESFPFRSAAVKVMADVDPAVPPRIVSDELKLFRSALNYLTNALQSTETGLVRLRVYVQEPKEKNCDDGECAERPPAAAALVFECQDTGPGVDEAAISIGLFEPVRNRVRAGEETSSSPGLGLFSVASNIDSLGGRYGYHKKQAVGTEKEELLDGAVFWFSVPLVVPYASSLSSSEHEPDKEMAPGSKPSSATSSPSGTGQKLKMLSLAPSHDYDSQKVFDVISKTVMDKGEVKGDAAAQSRPQSQRTLPSIGGRTKRALVIDDSVVTRESVGQALTAMGFRVDSAKDGMEGLQALQTSRYDVVFCDFLLPVMDGIDCVQRYRSWEATHRPSFRQRIIGLSEHDSDEDVKQGTDAGMDGFVSKALRRRDILDKAISVAKGPLRDSSKDLGKSLPGLDDMPLSRHGTHADFSSLLRGGKPSRSIHIGFPSRPPPNLAPIKFDAALSMPSVSMAMSSAAAFGERKRRLASETAAAARDAASASGMAISAVRSPSSHQDKCLIAIDSRYVLKVLRRIAELKGWMVKVGDDGEDALRLLKVQEWGAALIGDDLAELDGPQCMARFREWETQNRSSRQGNVFLICGKPLSQNGDRASAVPEGFDGFLEKPIKPEDAESLLGKARLRRFDRMELL